MKESFPAISELFPDLFHFPRPVIAGSNPLIMNASLLILGDVPMLPIVGGREFPPVQDNEMKLKKYAAIGGHPVLEAIMKADPKDYQKLLMTKSQDMPIWIGSVKFTDTLDYVLNVFDKTGSGNAVVEADDHEPTMLSLKDVVMLFEKDKLKTDARVFEVSSQKVSMPNDTTITSALKMMFSMNIRRVFVSGNRSDKLRFVSSRDIIGYLFSPQSLDLCRNHPESWLSEKLSNIPSSDAGLVSSNATLNEASRLMGQESDACLVSRETDRVISRWDIVMKPWRLRMLHT